ncbi:hypothetical protein WH50_20835 [Pokkaliibacter plantistimulans]|uniref:Cytochrome c domain-containing protein n=1 Tax=Pokkaliibacter plantistimulans TaxID=1635171 RepID=A0ABX5LS22_9GAMM|nr:hypothetical protein [Pokkaliibacter plantistimulans]PXF29439.1 hypothetical protein WH50_20835 [Pokkaliibacter plantistimulans]
METVIQHPLPIRWYRILIGIGVVINMTFAIPALLFPNELNTLLGLPLQAFYPWLENTGMLLIGISLFYLPSGFWAARYPLYDWLCVLSRLVAVLFWLYLISSSPYPDAFTPLLYSDLFMFVALGLLLYLGVSPAYRPQAMLQRGLCAVLAGLRCLFSGRCRKYSIIALLVVGFVGFEAWYNLLRVVPQPGFSSDEEHFKYAPIGLGMEARIPLYIFSVLPKVCPQQMPTASAAEGWKAFGFIFEPGHSLPVGLAQRQIGYPSVEPNCALCHTGRYRQSSDEVATAVPTAPATFLNLERFQWFLYDCAASSDFVSNTLQQINAQYDLGPIESLFYRFLIVPMTRTSLIKQGKEYGWQKIRPEQGPGRTDTFNPTKMVIFGFPDDSTIGTVDLPQIWNQQPRESMYLHWDGNNNDIRERNYAAAMAVGATPNSVLPDEFKRVTDWLLTHQPPSWPYALDNERQARGQVIWQGQCASCHEFGKVNTGQVTTSLSELGTDPYRVNSFTVGLVQRFHQFKTPPFDFGAYRKTYSYSNTPTDGIWLRAPYLHNGSVPSLWDLLQKPEQRPVTFYRGNDVIDTRKVGYVSDQPGTDSDHYFLFDTRLPGNSNAGHLYGTDLSDSEKWDLIEYMKSL